MLIMKIVLGTGKEICAVPEWRRNSNLVVSVSMQMHQLIRRVAELLLAVCVPGRPGTFT